MPRGNLVPLGSDTVLPEARQAAERLKAAGIPCYLRGEAAALIAADSARAVVRLEVDEVDLEHAQLILSTPPGTAPPRPTGPASADFEDMAPSGLATVEVFYDSLEAKHATDLLRARGIPCGLRGTTEGVLPWLAPDVPRLRLEVREGDLERAFEILGFTVDAGEGEERAGAEDAVAGTNRIRAAEPPPSRQIERHPFHPVDTPQAPAATAAPPIVDDLGPLPVPPSVEAGSRSGSGSLVWTLLLITGAVLVLGIFLLL